MKPALALVISNAFCTYENYLETSVIELSLLPHDDLTVKKNKVCLLIKVGEK